MVGFASVIVAMALGIALGLLSGYLGGAIDARDHAHRRRPAHLPGDPGGAADRRRGARHHLGAAPRRDRASTSSSAPSACPSGCSTPAPCAARCMVEKNKEYVQAARVIGLSPVLIMVRHVLPNVMGPVLVIATINLGLAIITEATLSFLGVGLPPTEPSLGTLIRLGNEVLFSGDWWITVFPGVTLVAAGAGGEPARRLAARRAQSRSCADGHDVQQSAAARGQEPARRIPDAARHAAGASTTSRSTSRPARSWAWSANRAPASR